MLQTSWRSRREQAKRRSVKLIERYGSQLRLPNIFLITCRYQAALTSHPDKVPEDEREEADVKFKAISEAYEILYDDQKREMYDTHGMSAFEKGHPGAGGGADVDLDDILAQMFGGMGGGGMGGMPGMGGGPRKPRKGKNEEQEYKVSLEDLYKGKTVKFASVKNVICRVCKGSGGKEKAKSRQCATCGGKGMS